MKKAPYPQPKTWIFEGCGTNNTHPVNNFGTRPETRQSSEKPPDSSSTAAPQATVSTLDRCRCSILTHGGAIDSRPAWRLGNAWSAGHLHCRRFLDTDERFLDTDGVPNVSTTRRERFALRRPAPDCYAFVWQYAAVDAGGSLTANAVFCRKFSARRGGRVAEGGGLLNRYTGNTVSRVRIPSSPPLRLCDVHR